jgi:hypothetical protein
MFMRWRRLNAAHGVLGFAEKKSTNNRRHQKHRWFLIDERNSNSRTTALGTKPTNKEA